MPQMARKVSRGRLIAMNEKSQTRDVEKICQICGVQFLCPRHRQQVAKYCSRTCYYKAMAKKGGVELACDICGTIYRRSPSHSHYITKTCSYKCRGIATRSASPVSGDFPSVRKWMRRRAMIKCCERCSYETHPEILVVHHRDRDRTNNDLNNLEVLCPNCHALEHYRENKEGWHHASTARRNERNRVKQYPRNDAVGT